MEGWIIIQPNTYCGGYNTGHLLLFKVLHMLCLLQYMHQATVYNQIFKILNISIQHIKVAFELLV
jgi:hypothetical protein